MSGVLSSDSSSFSPHHADNFRGPCQHAQSDCPRPSSTGSFHSCSGCSTCRGPKTEKKGDQFPQQICIGEEVKIAINIALDRFRMNDQQKDLEFPSSLTATERAYIHRLCAALGLKTQSKGKGHNRYLVVSKKNGNVNIHAAAKFQLVRNSRHNIHGLIQRFPVTNKENQELTPRVDKSIPYDGVKELSKTTTGRLNNGVSQKPPKPGSSEFLDFQKTLPVYGMKDEILDAINNHQVVLVSGETGSGKTTQVPQLILKYATEKEMPCRIFCTQPRRISALSVAERVAAERGEKIGQTVGYQIRLESRVSPKTLLTYCTNGVLLRTLMGGDNALSTVTHVIVDEIHERDRFCDFLLIALRQLLHRYKHLKVILMSAALNTELFVQYFGGCPIVSVPGKLYDVKEYFLEGILKWTGYTNKTMKKFKEELERENRRVQQLEEWCSFDLPSETKHSELSGDTQVTLSETNIEKEEIEPWLVKEMDNLLSEAFLGGDEEVFSQIFHLMSSEGVSVDFVHSETGATPLMIAAGRGFYSTVEYLLDIGASTNVRTCNDWTALDWARKFQQTEVVELLESYMATETKTGEEISLDKSAENLTPADKELLKIYHHSFDDEKVDLDLIASLVFKLHTSQMDEGAILVFLPGYDEIVSLREMILTGDKRFQDSNRYILYTLHSAMQSADQKQVFKKSASGVRKIILATNIAETSVTINDVVYVIDSGKVKEKSYDALTSVSMLKTNWISKASALQRKGRAGRCQPGVCYHLFSQVRHESMQEFQEPEIIRYPLQEMCLHTKLLAPSGCSIADYLTQAPQPPAYLITRNAVQILKQIDALDPFEDLTEIGHHLADLPLEPRLGKMVLYSVVLKCLDPVLTVACALAYRDPFILPAVPSQRRAAIQARRKFSAGTFSDHMVLLRVFQGWQRARSDGWEKTFCEKNYLSAATMEMIVGMRTQLLGQLRASGFVRARGGGDIRDLNTNSENWSVVKAALCAGTYPNIMRVDRGRQALTTIKEKKVRIHQQSVLSPGPNEFTRAKTQHQAVSSLPTDWVIYDEMTRNERLAHIRCATVVSPITLFLFSGPAKLPAEAIREAELGNEGRGDAGFVENSSDSESDQKRDFKRSTLHLDEWLTFKGDIEAVNLALQLRQKWHSLMLRRMRSPSKPWSQVDEHVVRTIINVLTSEEQAIGLQQPSGIGQRPRPMTTDYVMSGGNSRRGSYDTQSDDSSSENKATIKTIKKSSSPFKRKELFAKICKGDDRSDTSSVRSGGSVPGSGNNSGNNSLRGSAASSPGGSPLLFSPARFADKENTSSSKKYFVMRCNSFKQLDVSTNKGIWVTTITNEKKLSRAFKDGKTVYLIFSVHGSGQFQGFAKMLSLPVKEKVLEFSFPGAGGCFTVEWLKRHNIQFQQTQHIVNPWNESRKIQISRDGQDIQPQAAQQLVKLWDGK